MAVKVKILIFCMIFVANAAFSQNLSVREAKKGLLVFPKKPVNTSVLQSIPAPLTPMTMKPPVSPGVYAENLGFFCRQEIKLEKATKIPFKFRLGSVQECDRMEGKRY